jgi:hypothetical protein
VCWIGCSTKGLKGPAAGRVSSGALNRVTLAQRDAKLAQGGVRLAQGPVYDDARDATVRAQGLYPTESDAGSRTPVIAAEVRLATP